MLKHTYSLTNGTPKRLASGFFALAALACAQGSHPVPSAATGSGDGQDSLSPAFSALDQQDFEAVWTRGMEDGQKRRDLNGALGVAKRQIDSYMDGPITKAGCSWAWMLHPRTLVYTRAHNAGEQYWGQDEIDRAKADMSKFVDADPKYIGFYVELNEMPRFAGLYGALTDYADPSNLTNVRCVLKVGDRVIQPTQQPGNMTVAQNDNVNFFTVPTTTYIGTSSSSSATVYGRGRVATATASNWSSYAVTNFTQGSTSYSTYKGRFSVLFPLRDDEGHPLITPSDRTVQLVVIKKSATLSATYKLSDWEKAFEK